MINMIWAMDKNNLIGDGNRIPWHVKEDLIYYKNKTKGQTVLMGDATYFSLKSYY
ncbi:MAG: dihydrofolate reductase, partial [Acholeplasmatales bacterium]|nr:dihydrofolate reductase [Acholeplasmatales bacterium]